MTNLTSTHLRSIGSIPLLRWAASSSFALLMACGNATDQADPEGIAAAAAGGGGNASGAASAGGDPVSTPGGDGGNAGSAALGGDGGSASVPLEEQPLLPLVPGRFSSFAYTPIEADQPMLDTCAEPTTSVESGEGLSFDGHEGTLYRTLCAPEPFLIEGEGDSLTAYEINDGELVLPAFAYIHSPVVTGEEWDSGRGDHYTWQEVLEPLVTPAGTFEACWHRQGVDVRITYCRGVGLVQALAPYANFQVDLVEKNF